MLEHKVSPLLDAMEVGECFAQHDGASCYRIVHPESGREFVLKHISVPASRDKVEALLLTGAYASEEEVNAYYRKEAEALVREAEARKKLLDCPYILPFLGVQMEMKEEGVGYDVYAVLPKRNSLQSYLNENAISHLRGINMGIDLCVALQALREEGFVHGNLKPGNVFFSDTGRFLLGDFGLISTQDMQYAVLPEQYRSSYSAPELSGILGGLNPTVDIYSLGMILYRIYNGNHAPFEDEQTSPKAAEAKRQEGEELPAPLFADYELAQIIRKACAHDPADRYQTPEEMRLELEQYMRRNAVSDHLIVPPLVTDPEPLSPEAAQAEPEPVRFTDPEKLDDTFKKTFAPEEGKKPKKEKRERRSKRDNEPLPQEDKPILSDEPPQLAADRRRLFQKQKKTERRRKRAWIIFAAVMVLLVAFIGLYEFTDLGQGLWHYFVTVEKLEVADITDDSMKLRLDTNVDPDGFTALCQDAYGNSYQGTFEDGVASFSGLNPETQYNLKVELPGLHKVSGPTTVSAATKARTEILTFTAAPGAEAGAVELSLTVRKGDREPAFWTLEYGKPSQDLTTIQFAGHSCQITDLELGEEYTFQLLEAGDLFLSGQTKQTYTPVRAVEASELNLDDFRDGVANLSWRCASELPETWDLKVLDPEGKPLPVELHEAIEDENGWYCTASVSGAEPGKRYSVTLSAEGLRQPLTMELEDTVIHIENLAAETTPEGIRLTWAADREPAGGWTLTAAFGEGMDITAQAEGTECLLPALPEIEYQITLSAADGSILEGETTVAARGSYNQRFTQLGLTQGTTIGTYFTPDKEEWDYWELGSGTIRYGHDDRITYLVTAGGWPQDTDQEVTIFYVVRDGNDNVVNLQQETAAWNTLWDGNRWSGQIPWLPETPGSYSFTIYVNSQRIGTIPFTLIEK